MKTIAKRVVIRHVCHCDGAIEKPADDEAQEHVFTVDGEEFPWFISQRGQIVKRLFDDLYSVDVEIIQIDKETMKTLPFGWQDFPIIGGREFPWLLTDDVMTLTFGHKVFPTLRLAFLAHEVDANIPIEDLRPDQQSVYCAGGGLYGKERCHYGCDELIDHSDLWNHIQETHPKVDH